MLRLSVTGGNIVGHVHVASTVFKIVVESLESSWVVERCNAAVVGTVCEKSIDLKWSSGHNVGCTVRVGAARGVFAESGCAGQIVCSAGSVEAC